MMRYAVSLLALACAPSVAENVEDEVGAELRNEVTVVVNNRAFDNVIVRVCLDEVCRPVVAFVGARNQGRGVLRYDTDIDLILEVQYLGRDPGIWRSGSLYWITPGICIAVDVQHYEMRRNNSVGRCSLEPDAGSHEADAAVAQSGGPAGRISEMDARGRYPLQSVGASPCCRWTAIT